MKHDTITRRSTTSRWPSYWFLGRPASRYGMALAKPRHRRTK